MAWASWSLDDVGAAPRSSHRTGLVSKPAGEAGTVFVPLARLMAVGGDVKADLEWMKRRSTGAGFARPGRCRTVGGCE